MTYTVIQAGAEWVIRQNGEDYAGYRSEASATRAAVAVATKLGRNGHETFVLRQKPDGTTESVFASDPEPPTLDGMLDSAR